MGALLFAIQCGGGAGSKCLQLDSHWCQCWIDPPPAEADEVKTEDCTKHTVAPSATATGGPACCAKPGYPKTGECYCFYQDDGTCLDGFSPVEQCESGGILSPAP